MVKVDVRPGRQTRVRESERERERERGQRAEGRELGAEPPPVRCADGGELVVIVP